MQDCIYIFISSCISLKFKRHLEDGTWKASSRRKDCEHIILWGISGNKKTIERKPEWEVLEQEETVYHPEW